ncbi:hypothetical protein BGW80DRAFT_1466924 [Lactifluus volemus]|nr:hypothetical protein BGW80DRAFT_1466924 [Lactifluus volemus]
MLEELAAHHQSIQQQRFQQQVTKVLSDLSEDISDSSQPSPFGSPISIDTPNVMISSDISMPSTLDRTSAASIISTDSGKLQVEPETFDSLVALIIDNPVFYNDFNCSQFPVHLQLCVFLFCVGHYGNAASPEDTVGRSLHRVIITLLLHHNKAIHFPEADKKEDAKDFVKKQTCSEWRNSFLLADGTKFAFFQRPGLHGDAWFDKDGEYSIDCQLITMPHNLMIADYSVGHMGSVHNSWAFRSTWTYKECN